MVAWMGPPEPPTPSRYSEVVAIKDRLYKDMQRLEALLGRKIASDNIEYITSVLGLRK